jgi:hypothetical protein
VKQLWILFAATINRNTHKTRTTPVIHNRNRAMTQRHSGMNRQCSLYSSSCLRAKVVARLAQAFVFTTVAVAAFPSLVLAQTNAKSLPTKYLQPELKASPLPQDENQKDSLPKQVTLMLSDLKGLLLVDEQRLVNATRVVAIGDDFTIAATGDGILAQTPLSSSSTLLASLTSQTEVDIYHPSMRHAAELSERTEQTEQAEQTDQPDQDRPAAVELAYVGKAQLLKTGTIRSVKQPAKGLLSSQLEASAATASPTEAQQAWLQITESKGVVRQGDLVFLPRSLSNEWLDSILSSRGSSIQIDLQQAPAGLSGSVLSLFGARQWGARGDSVVVDLGTEDGLQPGMVVSLEYQDVAMPPARALIYRTTDRHAQALVLSAPSPVQVGSGVYSEAASN